MSVLSQVKITTLFAALCIISASAFAQVGSNDTVLNPNRASAEDLAALPGLSEDLAETIVKARPFLSMTQLNDLLKSSLGEEERKTLYMQLFLPINLNTASREEILLVPGIGKKMAHEFEEYRPYKAIAQWRREMGKYVDDDEVARMEQFVFVPIRLNSASDENILSIPGIGKKMLHEFKEYRPYKNIEQFRREIGKYVSDDEVARFERYVVVD